MKDVLLLVPLLPTAALFLGATVPQLARMIPHNERSAAQPYFCGLGILAENCGGATVPRASASRPAARARPSSRSP